MPSLLGCTAVLAFGTESEHPMDGRSVGGRRRGSKSGALPGEIWGIFQESELKFQGNRIEARSTFASRSRSGRGRVSGVWLVYRLGNPTGVSVPRVNFRNKEQ